VQLTKQNGPRVGHSARYKHTHTQMYAILKLYL